MTLKLFALIAAPMVYALWECRAQIWAMIRNPSPAAGEERGSWVKHLLGKGSDPSDDPDEDDEAEELDEHRYRLVDDQQAPGHTRVEWLNTPRPARLGETKKRTGIDDRIAGLLNKGWRYSEIRDDAMDEFGVSEATFKRALRRVKEAKEAEER
jgi:hypothetical protein